MSKKNTIAGIIAFILTTVIWIIGIWLSGWQLERSCIAVFLFTFYLLNLVLFILISQLIVFELLEQTRCGGIK